MKEFNTEKTIETERLLLRFMKEEDTEAIFKNIYSDKEVLKYFVTDYCEEIENMPLCRQIESSIKSKRYFMAVILKETGETIGMSLWCSKPDSYFHSVELGYAIGKKYWNRGYGTEILKAMINFTFDEGVHKVYTCYLDGNIASKKVMEKAGMIFEGIHKEEVYYHERYSDTYYYYLIHPKKEKEPV